MGLFKDCGCGCNGLKQQEKFVTSLISGLTFFIIANPETFRLVRRVLGPRIATPNGCPSTMGLLVHTLVFSLVVWGMMNVKKDLPVVRQVKETTETTEPVPPIRQVDVVMKPGMVDVTPEPGMEEEGFVDTGLKLGSMDINGPSL